MGTGPGHLKGAEGGPTSSRKDALRADSKGGRRRVPEITRFPNNLTMLPNI
jgi:hypothetical protein